MNPQFGMMVDPTELTKDDDENGKLRKIPVLVYALAMLSLTYLPTQTDLDRRICRKQDFFRIYCIFRPTVYVFFSVKGLEQKILCFLVSHMSRPSCCSIDVFTLYA